MRINLETDYAIRIADVLAKAKTAGERLSAVQISEKTNVSRRFTEKILRKLTGAEIVASYKGVRGGYELSRAPETLSLYDVVELVQGRILFSRCLEEDYDCSCLNADCEYQNVFGKITEEICGILKSHTFDKLM